MQRAIQTLHFTFVFLALFATQAQATQSPHLCVDAFGYEPLEKKICVVREAVTGFDAPDPYTPGAALQLRQSGSNQIIFSGPPQPWRNGALHSTSGDHTWHFEFSRVAEPGTYHVFDPQTGERSEDFEIATDVHAPVRRDALRTFYYQRCGVPKATPHADARWTDAACHVGPGQDASCRPIGNPSGLALDLSGGWHDAGDYNKYVNFADGVLHQLFDAYDAAPHAFDDAAGLPESGNGVPDILDECRFELQWFLAMQRPGGGVLHKISVDGFQSASPPSVDAANRWYAPVTASATASACGVFARGAVAFGALSDSASQTFAAQLETAALQAWSWLQQNPALSTYDNAGFSNVDAEDSAGWQRIVRVVAASWLARATGAQTYHDYVTANATNIPEYSLLNPQIGWASPYEFELSTSLLSYAESAGANAGLAQTIRDVFAVSMENAWLPQVENEDDPYRGWISDGTYHWGSNSVRARTAAMYAAAARAEGTRCDRALYNQTARDHAHWMHGVNPLGLCFLSNMVEAGAENSVQEIYHGWFNDGTIWDRAINGNPGPAPGIVPGGPNQYFAPAAQYNGPLLSPPMGQPVAKSYLDWNAGWPEESWEVTENSITYQAAYLLMLAEIAPEAAEDVTCFCPQWMRHGEGQPMA